MKNRQPQHQALSHETEFAIIRRDLLRVLLLNTIYLAIILALYFSDQRTHYLEQWFNKFMRF